jgi:hypothetical protein
MIINTERLIEMMEKFINLQQQGSADRIIAEQVLINFAEFLGKNLEEKSSAKTQKENLP